MKLTVSAAELSRNFGDWQSRAMMSPVTITHHGRDRLILASVDFFHSATRPSNTQVVPPLSANAQLRAVLNQMRDGFMAFDTELKTIDLNPAAELFFGLSRDEVLGNDLRDINPDAVSPIVWDVYKRVLRTREPVEIKVRSAGRDRPGVNMQIFPYDDEGIGVIFTNLAVREEAVILQARIDAATKAFAGQPGVSVIRLNLHGGFEAVDDAFCEMVGFPAEQLSDLMLIDIVHIQDRSLITHAFNDCVRHQAPRTVNLNFMRRNDDDLKVRISLSLSLRDSIPEDIIACVINIAKVSEI